MTKWNENKSEAATIGYAQEQAGYVKPPTTPSRKIVVDGEEFELSSFIRGDFSCRR